MRSVLTVVLIAAACSSEAPNELVVATDLGRVLGRAEGVSLGVRAFRGIPFAAPPVGENRFRPPQPAAAWDGVRDALDVGPICPQGFGFGPGGGDEDCLYLNVWTPAPAPTAPLPVMVWFHGGAFVFGSGGETYYAGTRLVERQGVVIVTVNYRLGPLGWLAHPALAAEDQAHPSSGNYGLEDQIAALEWVQRNIAAFGGDPANVTIFGESAGGFSVCAHYLSPLSRGLFHKVISESGLCTSSIVEETRAEAEAYGQAFAADLGCTGTDAPACLRAKSPWELVDASADPPIPDQLPGGRFYQDERPTWGPSVDGAVLPLTTHEAFAAGDFEPLPLLLGTNRNEGTLFLWSLIAKEVVDETEYRAALARRFGAANVDAIVQTYPLASFATPNEALAELTGDAFFVCPARFTARAAAAAGAPVYLYAFQRELEDLIVDNGGVVHAGEIPFVFGIDEFALGRVGAAGQPLADAMQDYWASFARTGTPAGDLPWPAYDAAGDQHMILDIPISTGTAHKQAVCDFWDALP